MGYRGYGTAKVKPSEIMPQIPDAVNNKEVNFSRGLSKKRHNILLLVLPCFSGRFFGRRFRPVIQIMRAVVAHDAFRELCQNALRMRRPMAVLAGWFKSVL